MTTHDTHSGQEEIAMSTHERRGKPTGRVLAGMDYEASRTEAIEKSERRAWMISRVAIVFALLAIVALAILAPFYKVVPMVIQVDKLTGEGQLVELTGAMPRTASDIVDKHWAQRYVQTRERYFWSLLTPDYELVSSMSGPSVRDAYGQMFEGPDKIQDRLKDRVERRVKVTSVVLMPGESGKKAVVRFDRTTRENGIDTEVRHFIATLAYDYVAPTTFQTERTAIENPLGFKVTGYAVDEEYKAPPTAAAAAGTAGGR